MRRKEISGDFMNEDTSTVNLSPRSKDQKEQVNYQGNTWI